MDYPLSGKRLWLFIVYFVVVALSAIGALVLNAAGNQIGFLVLISLLLLLVIALMAYLGYLAWFNDDYFRKMYASIRGSTSVLNKLNAYYLLALGGESFFIWYAWIAIPLTVAGLLYLFVTVMSGI